MWEQQDIGMREHLYSTSVVILTINGAIDDTNYKANIDSKKELWESPFGDTNHFDNIGRFRLFGI